MDRPRQVEIILKSKSKKYHSLGIQQSRKKIQVVEKLIMSVHLKPSCRTNRFLTVLSVLFSSAHSGS